MFGTGAHREQMAVYRKRESMELFQRSGAGGSGGSGKGPAGDPAVDRLLKERSSVAASLRSINDVIRFVSSFAVFSLMEYYPS
jgi:hypothetical protein